MATPKKIKEAGDIDRQQFKEVSALTASWTDGELKALSLALASRRNIVTILPAEKLHPLRQLFDGAGLPKNNQIWELLQEVVRGHLLEREFTRYLVDHPLYAHKQKGHRYDH